MIPSPLPKPLASVNAGGWSFENQARPVVGQAVPQYVMNPCACTSNYFNGRAFPASSTQYQGQARPLG